MDVDLPAWVGEYGPAAGIALAVLGALLRGWLVPRRTVDTLLGTQREMIDLLKAQNVAEQAATTAERRARETAEQQAQTLIAEMATQTNLLRAIQQEAARRRDA